MVSRIYGFSKHSALGVRFWRAVSHLRAIRGNLAWRLTAAAYGRRQAIHCK